MTCSICDDTGRDLTFGGACTDCTEEGQAAVARELPVLVVGIGQNGRTFPAGRGGGTGTATARRSDTDTASEKQIAYIVSLGGTVDGHLTKWMASQMIETLKAAQATTTETAAPATGDRTNQHPGKCRSCGQTVEAGAGFLLKENGRWTVAHRDACPVVVEVTAAKVEVEISAGMYWLVDGGIARVQISRESGNAYAKRLVDGSFEYERGLLAKIDRRMTLDEAKAYGRQTGVCCCCGRTLTNPASIEDGIGPICASKV